DASERSRLVSGSVQVVPVLASCSTSLSSESTSTEPLQSSGACASSNSCSAHDSRSTSSSVPSKCCTSTVASSRSIATTSNSAPPGRRYQSPTTGLGEVMLYSVKNLSTQCVACSSFVLVL